MSRIYTANDFAPAGAHTGDRLTDYSDDDYEAQIATWIDQRLTTLTAGLAGFQNNKILLAGCGLGHELAALMSTYGFTDVWGCDASTYAIQRAQALFPQYANRFLLGDVTQATQMDDVRHAAGLSGGARFRAVVSDDILPCAETQAEASVMIANMSGAALGEAHIVSMRDADAVFDSQWGGWRTVHDAPRHMPGFLWLTAPDWRALLGNSVRLFDGHGVEYDQNGQPI